VLPYVSRRLAWAALLLLVVTFNAFILFYVVPERDTSFEASFAPGAATDDSGVNRVESTGSIVGDYLAFLGRLAHGDLGQSRTQEPVADIIWRAAPATASLVIGGAIVWLAIAVPVGVISAMRPRSLFDRAGMVFVLVGVAAQPLWLGYMLAYLFGYRLGWFPISGYCDTFHAPPGATCGGPVQWAYHLALPWLTFSLAFAAMYARMIRASLLETMPEDYVRTARAKGLSEWAVLRRHTARNALLPLVAMLGVDVGLAFAGALFVERAFRIPGIGFLTVTSLQARDLSVLLGIVMLVSVAIVVCNLVVDLVVGVLDPRVGGRSFARRRRHREAAAAAGSDVKRPAPAPMG
jgi:peptide/nickel transport system permease protein